MTFASDLRRFSMKVEAKTDAVYVGSCALVLESIQVGSTVTGAPGQPVDTGYLRGSWLLRFLSKTVAQISTGVAYAGAIEDGTRASYDPRGTKAPPRPAGSRPRRSTVGGRHSVKLTRAAWQRIVATVARRLA